MKVKDVMSRQVISVSAEESLEVAARLLSRYNVGALPVCGADRQLQGILTDRDIVLRCVAAGQQPDRMSVRQAMSNRIISVRADDHAEVASALMAREQVRRLPVTENGQLVGMLSLGDLAVRPDYSMEAAEALTEISSNIQAR